MNSKTRTTLVVSTLSGVVLAFGAAVVAVQFSGTPVVSQAEEFVVTPRRLDRPARPEPHPASPVAAVAPEDAVEQVPAPDAPAALGLSEPVTVDRSKLPTTASPAAVPAEEPGGGSVDVGAVAAAVVSEATQQLPSLRTAGPGLVGQLQQLMGQ